MNDQVALVGARLAPPTILVVEDDHHMRELVVSILSALDAEVHSVENPQEALEYLELHPVSVVVSDLRMPRGDGLQVLRFAKQRDALTQVIMVTGFASVESAVESLKAGAFDYICKPFENVELRCVVERALDYWRLSAENQRLREVNNVFVESNALIGRSSSIENVHRLVDAAAAYDCSVLITGESGTGKEVVARQIHLKSDRRDMSFVPINCAAIPEHIIESELFGFQKGAFTGADRTKQGLFERAQGGTIFLDEVNNASLALQAKLLRIIQDGSFYRLGDTEARQVDVRVLAATNRDPAELIADGQFREDLYYRLRVVEVALPPLRERREDIPLLASYFLSKYAKRFGREPQEISTPALGALMRHEWPGNVRELENVVQSMLVFSRGGRIDVDVLPADILSPTRASGRAIDHMQPRTLEEIQAYFIKRTLRETDGDKALCAEILGIDKSTLWRKIKRYGLDA